MSRLSIDDLPAVEREAILAAQAHARTLGCVLKLKFLPHGAGPTFIVESPGGTRELANLLAVSIFLRDHE